MKLPRLLEYFAPVRSSGGDTFLLAEGRHVWIQAGAQSDLLPYLDGTRTIAQVASEVASTYSLPIVINAVQRLERLGVLADGPASVPDAEVAFWDMGGIDPDEAHARLATADVEVTAVGTATTGDVVAALAHTGIGAVAVEPDSVAASSGGDPTTLVVVVTDDHMHPDLDALNRRLVAAGRSWVLANTLGTAPWTGPLFEPGETGCWQCLYQRLDSNRMVHQYLKRFGEVTEFPALSRASLPSGTAMASAVVATEVAKFLGYGSESTSIRGRLLATDLITMESTFHALIRQPQCPVCGDPSILRQGPEVLVGSSPINYTADAGFRSSRPEETYERLEKHISRITGAVSWLEPTYKDPEGLCHGYTTGHNFAMLRNSVDTLKRNLRGNSGGKGTTDMQAKVSAICEAIERYSGVWTEDRPVTTAVHRDLDGRSVLPNELMLFAERQFEERKESNAHPLHRLHQVPEPFDEDMEISWSAAWSLTNHEPVHVPAAYAWFGHPDAARKFFTYSDGNGNASGNNLDEAILQGFCELVERDAVGMWWYNRARRPAVDLTVFDDPYITALRESYRKMDRELWVLDLTNDLGVPTFAAVSPCIGRTNSDIIVAFGAHFDPHLALLRALTETNQFLPAVLERDANGDTVYTMDDIGSVEWWTNSSVETEPWLLPAEGSALVDPRIYEIPRLPSVGDYVDLAVERTSSIGLEMLVLDQSRPDLELSVAKVMVPGIRHFWRRLAPGRLFDKPVELGWVPERVEWDDINPRSVFF